MNRTLSYFALIWELPLTLLSYILFKLVKMYVMLAMVVRMLRSGAGQSRRWRVNSEEMVFCTPGILLKAMLVAPRWNTAAMVGTLGPIRIDGKVRFDLTRFRESSEHWVFIIYKLPKAERVVYLSPRTRPTIHDGDGDGDVRRRCVFRPSTSTTKPA